ncbi:hypothetical protein GmHk_09G026076 [Glycine max]|nr:hypothetical protein GmHk_09G026076 [Glycine max]
MEEGVATVELVLLREVSKAVVQLPPREGDLLFSSQSEDAKCFSEKPSCCSSSLCSGGWHFRSVLRLYADYIAEAEATAAIPAATFMPKIPLGAILAIVDPVYFNNPRPLEPERLKALRIQWAQYYLRVRDQT